MSKLKIIWIFVIAITCLILAWWSLINWNKEKNSSFTATTQSVKNTEYNCSVSIYPESPISLLSPIEITINGDLPGPWTQIDIVENTSQWEKKGKADFTGFPKVIERTFLKSDTYKLNYTILNNEWNSVSCDTTINVVE